MGFGSTGTQFAGSTASVAKSNVVNAGGSSATGDLTFTPLQYGSDNQAITVSANNSSGEAQATTINLANTGATRNGQSIDQAVAAINTALQQTNNATLQQITAVVDNSTGTEKINFISSLPSFQVSVGSTASGDGVGSQGQTVSSAALAGGSSLDISSQQGGTAAVAAVTNAVAALGSAQANVGKAENTLNYAISLAESQESNFAAAESRVRDADMATEAANLTKAQVLQQSAIAAMVQANSAPQVVLTLLRG
ncbi:MAG: flagellin [Bryobacteraceae bacterium]|jgi:flagellin